MTEIQNTKQLAFDRIWDLDIVIWNLFVIWCLSFVISGLSGFRSLLIIFVQSDFNSFPLPNPVTANPSTGKKTTLWYLWPASRRRWLQKDPLPWDTKWYWPVPGPAAGESLRWIDSDAFYRKLFSPRAFLPPWSEDCPTAGKYYPVPVSFRR